jgi:hypothetical protein
MANKTISSKLQNIKSPESPEDGEALHRKIINKSLYERYKDELTRAPLAFPIESLCLLEKWTADEAQCFVLGSAPEGTLFARPIGTWSHGNESDLSRVNFLFERELFRRASIESGSPLDWVTWCDAKGFYVDDDVRTAVQEMYPNEGSKPVVRKLSKAEQQRNLIVKVLKNLGYEVEYVPRPIPGKPGVKSEVWAVVKVEKSVFKTNKTFEKAWEKIDNKYGYTV